MSDLFSSPVLLMVQPSNQLNYQITDPQGAALAHVTQVAGNHPKKGFARFAASLAAEQDRSRVVVQVAQPDGAPLFFVDRAARPPGVWQAPCAVAAPDGQLIGHVEHDAAEVARTRLSGGGFQQLYRLLDAAQQPLCRIVWEQIRVETRVYNRHMDTFLDNDDISPRLAGGRFAMFTDMNGVQIAHLDISESGVKTDRFTLQIGYQLPEPLRTLVIAAPLAMDLMNVDRDG